MSKKPEVAYSGSIEHVLRQLANDVEARRSELSTLKAKLSKMEARLEYAEDVLGNVGMDDTLDYLEESWPLAGGDDE